MSIGNKEELSDVISKFVINNVPGQLKEDQTVVVAGGQKSYSRLCLAIIRQFHRFTTFDDKF